MGLEKKTYKYTGISSEVNDKWYSSTKKYTINTDGGRLQLDQTGLMCLVVAALTATSKSEK